MAEIRQFSPAQIEEAEKWYRENQPELLQIAKNMEAEYLNTSQKMLTGLYCTYFDLKVLDMELRKNQFIIAVDYRSKENVLAGKEQINLSFWNPHGKGMADQFAKEILIAKLSKL